MKFRKVSLAVFLVAGLSYFAVGGLSQQPPAPATQLAVFDALGRKVGGVVDLDNLLPAAGSLNMPTPVIILRVATGPAPVRVYRNRFGGYMPVVFESTDCSGPAYIDGSSLVAEGTLFPLVGVGFPGNSLYVADGQMSQQTVSIGSATGLHNDDAENAEVCEPAEGEVSAVPAQRLTDLTSQFTAPFTVH